MTIIIIIALIFLIFFLLIRSCNNSYETKSGKIYYARDLQTAEIINILRDISFDLSSRLTEPDKSLLEKRLQNTSFRELIYTDPNILGWNYNKGGEIGIRIYDSTGKMYPDELIISTLIHELAHSLTERFGHHENWRNKDDYLQNDFTSFYVDFFKKKRTHLN